MLKELHGFIRRNGLRAVFVHVLELYVGGFLRLLPGVEGLFLRSWFYRAVFKAAGRDLLIYPSVYIIFSRCISVGRRVAINTGTYIDGRGGLTIGDHVMIGPNCVLSTCDHGFKSIDEPMYVQPIEYGPIVIEDDVWLGAHVCVRRGVTIHRGAVVAAGCVVTKDVPAYSIFGGVPGKVLGNRKPEAAITR